MTKITKNIVVGYEEYEDIIIANLALNKNIAIIGKHGVGKTTLAKVLSKGYGEAKVQYYDCTKADLVRICGIPNIKEIEKGNYVFTAHAETIWDKDVIILDELTRANKENQSMWMEVLEEHSLFGIPLKFKSIITAMNPETYASTYQLDQAVWDRFDTVVFAPDFQDKQLSEFSIKEMVKLNLLSQREDNIAGLQETLKDLFAAIKKEYDEILNNRKEIDKIIDYVSKLMKVVLVQVKSVYISSRTFSKQLPEQIVCLLAYYRATNKSGNLLELAARRALIGTLVNKVKVDVNIIMSIHETISKVLNDTDLDASETLLHNYMSCVSIEDRLNFIDRYSKDLNNLLNEEQLEIVVGNLFQDILESSEIGSLVILENILKKYNIGDELKKQVEGTLTFKLNEKMIKLKSLFGIIKIKNDNIGNLATLIDRIDKAVSIRGDLDVKKKLLQETFSNKMNLSIIENKLKKILGTTF